MLVLESWPETAKKRNYYVSYYAIALRAFGLGKQKKHMIYSGNAVGFVSIFSYEVNMHF